MEKIAAAEKSNSFSRNGIGNKKNENVGTPKYGDNYSKEFEDEGEDHMDMTQDKAAGLSLPEVVYEVDQFLERDESQVQVPESVLLLPKLVGSMVDKYNASRYRFKFGRDPGEDTRFLEAVDRISKLSNKLSQTQAWSQVLDKTISALEKAMYLLEKELCNLVEDPKANPSEYLVSKTPRKTAKKSSSFNSLSDSDLSIILEHESPPANTGTGTPDEEEFPGFSPEAVSNMNKIATTMIDAGYEIECHMSFSNFRRTAFKTLLHNFGYVTISMEEIQRMQWESLEGQIGTWINVVRHFTTTLFSAERRLYESVFPNNPSVSGSLFSALARAVIIHFLNFAEAITLTRRSVERLFKFLDMYETLRDLEPLIDDSYPQGCAQELAYETATAKGRLGEAVASMFCDLENSIKSDNERIPVPNGAVHPLTRYVLNYLKYACEYRDTLEQVFQQLLIKGTHNNNNKNHHETTSNNNQGKTEDGTPKNSPFSVQLMTVMDLLNANLEMKSRLYRDPALRFIFLMNNGRYIVQKVKGSAEIHESMGDNWCRKRQSALKLYHKNYQRETWSKVLQCLSHEGLLGNGKVSKPVLKERFKTFNTMFEEIHKVQSTWVVSDEQLQSEMRVSISAVMIPAYRSFLARFKQHLDSSRQMDKYIKYHPEDIESLIDDLFGGYASSMARRRN